MLYKTVSDIKRMLSTYGKTHKGILKYISDAIGLDDKQSKMVGETWEDLLDNRFDGQVETYLSKIVMAFMNITFYIKEYNMMPPAVF